MVSRIFPLIFHLIFLLYFVFFFLRFVHYFHIMFHCIIVLGGQCPQFAFLGQCLFIWIFRSWVAVRCFQEYFEFRIIYVVCVNIRELCPYCGYCGLTESSASVVWFVVVYLFDVSFSVLDNVFCIQVFNDVVYHKLGCRASELFLQSSWTGRRCQMSSAELSIHQQPSVIISSLPPRLNIWLPCSFQRGIITWNGSS